MEAEEAGPSTSSKPERQQLSPDTVEKRREALTNTFELYVDQRMENVEEEHVQRNNRMMRLEQELMHSNDQGWSLEAILINELAGICSI